MKLKLKVSLFFLVASVPVIGSISLIYPPPNGWRDIGTFYVILIFCIVLALILTPLLEFFIDDKEV